MCHLECRKFEGYRINGLKKTEKIKEQEKCEKKEKGADKE